MARDRECTLQAVEAFRTVYALCDIVGNSGSGDRPKLHASHYAVCLQAGRAPIWGVFSGESGKLTLMFDSRADIEGHRWYRSKVWRIKQAAWKPSRVTDPWTADEKREHIAGQIDGRAEG